MYDRFRTGRNFFTIPERPVLSMVTSMLDKAFEKISDGTELILHSTRAGSTSRSSTRECLKRKVSDRA